ncbi:serine/threonine-protein kinase [Nonomuraea sp. NPDC000554]|uniref:serine/threonine-protein kinase n=1 Tax=Nonomuraea sp. NPDC000554 TaxID=3154259 RepID=UPI003331F401
MQDKLLGGRYRLVRQLGEGGMGQVWEAQDETLGRPVAVKVISLLAGGGSRGDEARARFLREARITAQLQHPNIVTIHDLGETGTGDNRVPFLVMERVRGEGLDTMLRQGVVTLPDAARWGAQICDALTDAHDAGIMHRDIKPSNILITPSGTVKVLDFGVARAADPYATADRLTQTGFIVGTPPYMAPEQARGFPEPRSDLYALGCLLFELTTGRLPFQSPDTVGYLSAHLTQEPPTPSSVAQGIPPAWDDLVLTLLRKDPAQRYPTAADLSQALRRLDRAPEPPPSEESTPPPTKVGTTPLPPVAPPRAVKSSAPPGGPPAGTGLATLERFGPPAVLLVLLITLPLSERHGIAGYDNTIFAYLFVLGAALVLTAALTPCSRSLARGAGYVATTLTVGGVLWIPQLLEQGRALSDMMPLYYLLTVLTAATYCYRDIKTRRARSARGTSDSDGTATIAATLAFLCLPELLYMIVLLVGFLPDPSAPTKLIAVNLAVGIVEAALLATGALLLFQHKMAGRWMIMATGGTAALHGLSVSAQYLVAGGPPSVAMVALVVGPLMAVSATAAMITAALPSTGRRHLGRSQRHPNAADFSHALRQLDQTQSNVDHRTDRR